MYVFRSVLKGETVSTETILHGAAHKLLTQCFMRMRIVHQPARFPFARVCILVVFI